MAAQLTPLVVNEISIFAERHNVPAAQAYSLPVIFEKVAGIAGKPVRAIVSQATYTNLGLASYIKELAAQVS